MGWGRSGGSIAAGRVPPKDPDTYVEPLRRLAGRGPIGAAPIPPEIKDPTCAPSVASKIGSFQSCTLPDPPSCDDYCEDGESETNVALSKKTVQKKTIFAGWNACARGTSRGQDPSGGHELEGETETKVALPKKTAQKKTDIAGWNAFARGSSREQDPPGGHESEGETETKVALSKQTVQKKTLFAGWNACARGASSGQDTPGGHVLDGGPARKAAFSTQAVQQGKVSSSSSSSRPPISEEGVASQVFAGWHDRARSTSCGQAPPSVQDLEAETETKVAVSKKAVQQKNVLAGQNACARSASSGRYPRRGCESHIESASNVVQGPSMMQSCSSEVQRARNSKSTHRLGSLGTASCSSCTERADVIGAGRVPRGDPNMSPRSCHKQDRQQMLAAPPEPGDAIWEAGDPFDLPSCRTTPSHRKVQARAMASRRLPPKTWDPWEPRPAQVYGSDSETCQQRGEHILASARAAPQRTWALPQEPVAPMACREAFEAHLQRRDSAVRIQSAWRGNRARVLAEMERAQRRRGNATRPIRGQHYVTRRSHDKEHKSVEPSSRFAVNHRLEPTSFQDDEDAHEFQARQPEPKRVQIWSSSEQKQFKRVWSTAQEFAPGAAEPTQMHCNYILAGEEIIINEVAQLVEEKKQCQQEMNYAAQAIGVLEARGKKAEVKAELAMQNCATELARVRERELAADKRERVLVEQEHDVVTRKSAAYERELHAMSKQQLASERERIAFEREQAASFKEQAAAQQEAEAMRRQGVAIAAEQAATEREDAAAEREHNALKNQHDAIQREQHAAEREAAAVDKIEAAQLLEQAAVEKEMAAEEEREAAFERRKAALEREQAAEEKMEAAFQREEAAARREQAAAEREEAAIEREQAAAAREQAAAEQEAHAINRQHEAITREHVAREKDQVATQKVNAAHKQRHNAVQREQAAYAREQAALDTIKGARECEQNAAETTRAAAMGLEVAAQREQAAIERERAASGRERLAFQRELTAINREEAAKLKEKKIQAEHELRMSHIFNNSATYIQSALRSCHAGLLLKEERAIKRQREREAIEHRLLEVRATRKRNDLEIEARRKKSEEAQLGIPQISHNLGPGGTMPPSTQLMKHKKSEQSVIRVPIVRHGHQTRQLVQEPVAKGTASRHAEAEEERVRQTLLAQLHHTRRERAAIQIQAARRASLARRHVKEQLGRRYVAQIDAMELQPQHEQNSCQREQDRQHAFRRHARKDWHNEEWRRPIEVDRGTTTRTAWNQPSSNTLFHDDLQERRRCSQVQSEIEVLRREVSELRRKEFHQAGVADELTKLQLWSTNTKTRCYRCTSRLVNLDTLLKSLRGVCSAVLFGLASSTGHIGNDGCEVLTGVVGALAGAAHLSPELSELLYLVPKVWHPRQRQRCNAGGGCMLKRTLPPHYTGVHSSSEEEDLLAAVEERLAAERQRIQTELRQYTMQKPRQTPHVF